MVDFCYYCVSNGNEIVQYLAVFSATLNIITSGMVYGWPSLALPHLTDIYDTESNIHLTSSQGSWAAVMPLIGALFGSPFAGFTVNHIGRKNMIQFTFLPYMLSWILVGHANSVPMLYVGRFLGGISDGCIFTTSPMYIGEIANPKIRGKLGSAVPVCLVFGILLINILGAIFSIRDAATVATIIPIMSFMLMLCMPESPYGLIIKDNPKEAKRALQIFRGSEDVDEEFERIEHAVRYDMAQSQGALKDMVTISSNRKAVYIMMLLRGAQQLSGITAITFYVSSILEISGLGISPTIGTIFFFFVQLIMSVMGSYLVDTHGRRFLLKISCLGSFFALLIEGAYYQFAPEHVPLGFVKYTPLIALIAYIIFYGVGLQNIPVLMLSELFATNIKAIALCYSDIYFALMASIVSKLFQIINDSFGMYVSFYMFAFSSALSLILIIIFVPETKGITLEEIQCLLKEDSNGKRSPNWFGSSGESSSESGSRYYGP